MTERETLRKRLMTLEGRKKELEKELTDIYEFLMTPPASGNGKPPGVKGPLVDAEGFPRNDIDVHAVRTLRHKRAVLQTDYSTVMKEIEAGLHRIHQLPRRPKKKDDDDDNDDVSTKTSTSRATPSTTPFALVRSVVAGSPSFLAGLKENDRIVLFGSTNFSNHRNLQRVGETVRDREGQSITVRVIRDGNQINLSLTPRRWHGTGLLGCHIVPC